MSTLAAPHLSILAIRGRENSEEIPEWTAIELQGSLEQRDGAKEVAGREIGGMEISEDRKTAVLKIGNHQLKGSLVKLGKPLAVTRKRTEEDGPVLDDDGDLDLDSGMKTRGNQSTEYKVVAVVRYKYIFKTRPKPINGLAAKRQRLGYIQKEKP
jgi:hypothetical protein